MFELMFELLALALVDAESALLDDPLLLPCSKANRASCAVVPLEALVLPALVLSPSFKSESKASSALVPEPEVLSVELSSCSSAAIASCAPSPVVVDAVLPVDVESVDVDEVDDVDDVDDADADEQDAEVLCAEASALPPISGGGPGGGPGGCGIICDSASLNCCSVTLPVLLGSSCA